MRKDFEIPRTTHSSSGGATTPWVSSSILKSSPSLCLQIGSALANHIIPTITSIIIIITRISAAVCGGLDGWMMPAALPVLPSPLALEQQMPLFTHDLQCETTKSTNHTDHIQTPNPVPNPRSTRSLVPSFPLLHLTHPQNTQHIAWPVCLSHIHPPTQCYRHRHRDLLESLLLYYYDCLILLLLLPLLLPLLLLLSKTGWFIASERRWNYHALSTRELWLVFLFYDGPVMCTMQPARDCR